MKNIFLILFLSFPIFGNAQVSYDFSTAFPIEKDIVFIVDENNFGSYVSENNETHYEFNSEGVWIISTIFSSISRETIRESSKYVVRNGYIFGVVIDDSLPCELEGERYHFGMRNKEQIIGTNSKNILKKISSNSYIMNFFENGGYTPSLFTFSGKTLTIQHFDYETGTTLFSSIVSQNNKMVEGMNYITLSPTKKEWEELDKSKLFGSKINYKK